TCADVLVRSATGRGCRMDVSVTSKQVGERMVVEVSGEIDVSTAPMLREGIGDLVAEGHTEIVVDLRGIRFMDSTGLGVLVGALKKVRSLGGNLELVIDQDNVLKVFKVTGLTRVFTIHDTFDTAGAAGTSS